MWLPHQNIVEAVAFDSSFKALSMTNGLTENVPTNVDPTHYFSEYLMYALWVISWLKMVPLGQRKDQLN
jgi:hypothetical protein